MDYVATAAELMRCAGLLCAAGVDGRPLPYPTTNISFTYAGKLTGPPHSQQLWANTVSYSMLLVYAGPYPRNAMQIQSMTCKPYCA